MALAQLSIHEDLYCNVQRVAELLEPAFLGRIVRELYLEFSQGPKESKSLVGRGHSLC
jgi:hypothetical protein